MLPSHCLPTWAVCLPHLRSPCSSMTNTPFSSGAVAVFEQELQPSRVDLLGVPPGLGKEPLQALRLLSLRPAHWLGVRKGGQGLVALGGKQQAPPGSDGIPRAGRGLAKEAVKASGVAL